MFISAELASEQGGLGQQCGIDLLLAKILSKGNIKRGKKRERDIIFDKRRVILIKHCATSYDSKFLCVCHLIVENPFYKSFSFESLQEICIHQCSTLYVLGIHGTRDSGKK